MHSVTRWVSAIAASALFSLPARAEPPPSAPTAVPTAPVPTVAPRCSDVSVAETRAEELAFEAATERYFRFAELTRKLAEEAEREREQDFQAEVELYLKKRELTRSLADRNTGAAKPSPSPVW